MDYDLIVVKTLERVYKNYYYIIRGEYHLVVESVDKTDTAAYSDIKNLKLAFVVDQTAPVVVFSGLESGGRYEAQEQTVTAVPTDDGGKLKTFQAVVTDKKGEQKETLITLKGDELETYLAEHDGRISFEIPEGLEQQVTVSCSDHAVKEDGSTNTYDQTFDNVTVSTSKMIIFFANKPLCHSCMLRGSSRCDRFCYLEEKEKSEKRRSVRKTHISHIFYEYSTHFFCTLTP